MESGIKNLRRMSLVFKVLTTLSLVFGAFRLCLIFVPAVAITLGIGSGVIGAALIIINMLVFAGTAVVLFMVAVVLDYLADLGEEIMAIRHIQWAQVNPRRKRETETLPS